MELQAADIADEVMRRVVRPLHTGPAANKDRDLQHHINSDKHLELNLSLELQAKLDINSIINTFSHTLKTFVPHSEVKLVTAENSITSNRLEESINKVDHRESVDLIFEQTKIGVVTLISEQPVSRWAAIFFRYLTRYLVHPVKNALLIETLTTQTLTDPLTGALNRSALNHDLESSIYASARSHTPFTVVMIDIDFFKKINDNHGHTIGDKVLQDMSSLIQHEIRLSDSFYRYGGEEFTILLHNTNPQHAVKKIEQILTKIREHQFISSQKSTPLKITISAGVSEWQSNDDPESIISRADSALYQSKTNGRDRITIFSIGA
jgi:diguanylate cyclase (GGDEF)-like protein